MSVPPSKKSLRNPATESAGPREPICRLIDRDVSRRTAACCNNYVGTDIIVGTISRFVGTTLESVRNWKGE